MKKAVGYVRVSTAGQVGPDKYGIESQKIDILEYCAENGIEIIEWIEEGGVSGIEEKRPKLDKFLYTDDLSKVDALIVAKSDRLARDINLYFYYKFVLKREGVELLSVSEDFANMGTFGTVLESLTLFIAQQERQNIAARTAGGRRRKAAVGGFCGGRTPYGYRAVGQQLMIEPDEADMVIEIFRLRELGFGPTSISRKIMDAGYKSRVGGPFYPSHITSILSNRKLYEGKYKYADGKWVRGLHEPILGKDKNEEVLSWPWKALS